MYVPLFTDFTRSRVLVSTVFTQCTVNPVVTGSSPCFSQKLFRAIFLALCDLQFFSGTVRLFFVFLPSKGPTFKFFFDILQQTKVPKGLPFYVFRHYETVQNSHFSFFPRKLKKKIDLFLSLKGPLQFI